MSTQPVSRMHVAYPVEADMQHIQGEAGPLLLLYVAGVEERSQIILHCIAGFDSGNDHNSWALVAPANAVPGTTVALDNSRAFFRN